MTDTSEQTHDPALHEATVQLQEAVAAKKCWTCGCLHSSVAAIDHALPASVRPAELDAALGAAKGRLEAIRYDCLGCHVCYPALAVNALNTAGHGVGLDACAAEPVEPRSGWPPLPGSYQVLRYRAPVAVCTLTDEPLMRRIAQASSPTVSLVGTLQTENLGLERLITNLLANPHVRFLVVSGPDSRQAIGHLPGQSLVALARAGVDERQRIIGAHGKRPVLRNLSREAVEHFRHTVEVVDRVGHTDVLTLMDAIHECAARDPGPAEPFLSNRVIAPIAGYVPERMSSDPSGYFVVYVDRARNVLQLEHYRNEGVLDVVVEGTTAAELYIPASEKGLISRLDHAAYLGRELARAEHALSSGEPYVQDAAPEQRPLPASGVDCHCSFSCEEHTP
jgi:tetrahydromethanopterin S-methyltransferase subunit A